MVTFNPNLLISEIGLSAESTVSSLKFGRQIQDAILCNRNGLKKMYGDFSLLYQPKNIIGGDFYFFCEKNSVKYLAVCDCTGHGIAGALLTILGHNMLERAFKKYSDLGEILTFLNKYIIDSFDLNSELKGCGMDLVIVGIDTINNELEYCGARRPLLVLNNNGLVKYKTKKASIGSCTFSEWTSSKIKIKKGDKLYMFSDGVTDQFCDRSKNKLGSRQLCQFIRDNKDQSMTDFSSSLKVFFDTHRGQESLTDDALFLGVTI